MKPRTIGIIVVIALAVAVAIQYSRTEATIDRAYRECGLCSLERDEVDTMIRTVLTSSLTREQQIERYRATAKDGDDVEPCLPGVEAVLDLTDEMREDLRA